MDINLELLQQLPLEEEAEDGLCFLTCSYSFVARRGTTWGCEVTGF